MFLSDIGLLVKDAKRFSPLYIQIKGRYPYLCIFKESLIFVSFGIWVDPELSVTVQLLFEIFRTYANSTACLS